ncbi:protein-disulfide reductase DsbD domain-containing protein [Mucilaginibacter terrenus]|nr:protein-disulfide reductase DsbD domain-containing protein [Mucilaginibacter terrenus]
MKRTLIFLLTCLALSGFAIRGAAQKIDLKVLYVGYDPERPQPEKLVYYSTWEPAVTAGYKTRMADFKSYLNGRFTGVKVMDVRDYKPAESETADVTIFDAGPVNLPADFDRPAILLHAMAPNIGIPIKLKFDWYCQCLEDEALNVNTRHQIFNKPIKVIPTMIEKPTPSSFFNGHQAANTPKTMKMWRVVKESASLPGKYLIGMVSHGEGFADSPDAEVISGGDCLKNAEAVAIGRHGNYLMWGFSASPQYMTDEGKNVFINAICYIKKYDHKPVLVRKLQTATRSEIDELIYRIDEDLYKKALISRKEGNQRLLKMQEELRAKKAAGEDIGKSNEMFLLMPVSNEVQSFDDYLKQFAGVQLFAKYGTDVGKYHQYFRDNYEYFFPENEMALKLDTDARTLGVSNRNPSMLEKCVVMLENHDREDLAERLLTRYTNEKFTTAAEWRHWLDHNSTKLFFSESGGFKFYADTSGMKANPVAGLSQKNDSQKSFSDPVSVSWRIEKGKAPDTINLVVSAKILSGWHIYAYVPPESPFIQTNLNLKIKNKPVKISWQSTPGVALAGTSQTFVYEQTAEFSAKLSKNQIKGVRNATLGFYYQVCNDNKCLQPTEKKILIAF